LASSPKVVAVTTHAVSACTQSVGDRSATLAIVALSMSASERSSAIDVWSRMKTKRAISSSV